MRDGFSSWAIDSPNEDSFDNGEYEDYIAAISQVSDALSTGDGNKIAQTLEASPRDQIWSAISPFSIDGNIDTSFQGDEKQFEAVINEMRRQAILRDDPSWDKMADDVVSRWMDGGMFEEMGWWPDLYDEQTGAWSSQLPVLRKPETPQAAGHGGFLSRIGQAFSDAADDYRRTGAQSPFGGDPTVGGSRNTSKPMVAAYEYTNKNGKRVHVESYKNPRYKGPKR